MEQQLGEDEDIECFVCGDEIPCCHMDDIPPELRLCDACTYTALLAARGALERVEALCARLEDNAAQLRGGVGQRSANQQARFAALVRSALQEPS